MKPLHASCSKSEQCTPKNLHKSYICKYAPQPKHVSMHPTSAVAGVVTTAEYVVSCSSYSHNARSLPFYWYRLSGAALSLTSAQNKSKASCNSWLHSASSVLPHALLYSFELHPGLWLTQSDDALVACSDHNKAHPSGLPHTKLLTSCLLLRHILLYNWRGTNGAPTTRPPHVALQARTIPQLSQQP